MKKKIFGAVVVVAIAVGVMINVNLNKVSNKGDLALANVEALAEEGSDFPGNWQCTSTTSSTSTYMNCEYGSRLASMTTTYTCTSGLYGGCSEGVVTYSCDCSGNFTTNSNLTNKRCG